MTQPIRLAVRNVSAKARRIQVAIDCDDPDRLAAFWAAVLDYRVLEPPEGHATWADYSRAHAEQAREGWCRIVDPDSLGPPLLFHHVPEAKTVKNRVHLDVSAPRDSSDDRKQQIDAFAGKVVGFGALRLHDVTDDAGYFIVMQDPEGNEFCID